MYYRTTVSPAFRSRSVHPHFRDVSPLRDTREPDEVRKEREAKMDMAMTVTKARLGNIRVCFPAHA